MPSAKRIVVPPRRRALPKNLKLEDTLIVFDKEDSRTHRYKFLRYGDDGVATTTGLTIKANGSWVNAPTSYLIGVERAPKPPKGDGPAVGPTLRVQTASYRPLRSYTTQYIARIEALSIDSLINSLEVVRSTWSAAHACTVAARRLRALADRFDRLAAENDPLSSAAQKRANA